MNGDSYCSWQQQGHHALYDFIVNALSFVFQMGHGYYMHNWKIALFFSMWTDMLKIN